MGFVSLIALIIEHTNYHTTGRFGFAVQDQRQIWLPVAIYAIILILDVFIFLFFLAGIDTGMTFFEENPKISKHLVIT